MITTHRPVYLFFDTETTGLVLSWKAPLSKLDNWPRLVCLAWAACDGHKKVLVERNFLVKPHGFVIPPDAEAVHGITTAVALERGHPLQKVLAEFAKAVESSDIVVAHNIDFDEKVVGAEFLREKLDHQLFRKPRFCTMKSTAEFCGLPGPYGYKWPTLNELHRTLFGIRYKEAHNPVADVAACAKCFFELEKRGVLSTDGLLGVRTGGALSPPGEFSHHER